MRLLIKQMPSLSEGIVYVGMIRPEITENDFIITNLRGKIDSFSSGLTEILDITPGFFKESDVNLMMISPELIEVFERNKRIGG